MEWTSFVIGIVIGMVIPFGIAPLFKQLNRAYDEIKGRTSSD